MSNPQEQSYKIGAVSKLTGIPAATIRMWEKRYEATQPERTPKGGRIYRDNDVKRLSAIKRLLESGHAISNVANLTLPQLNLQCETASAAINNDVIGPIAVCIVGSPDFFPAETSPRSEVIVQSRLSTLADLERTGSEPPLSVDCLIAEVEIINAEVIRQLRSAKAATESSTVLVVYHFASKAHIELVHKLGIHTLRSPCSNQNILALSRSLLGQKQKAAKPKRDVTDFIGTDLPKRRFSPEALRRYSKLSSSVKCECPEHLASLVEQLVAFESYTEHCESENRQDIAIHMMLHSVTANVRRSFEDALEHVLIAEGIKI